MRTLRQDWQYHVCSFVLLPTHSQWIVGGKFEDVTVYLNETKEFDDHLKAVLYYRLSEAARLATERLLEAGHQKIACIAHEQDTSIIGGYKLAMQNSNQRRVDEKACHLLLYHMLCKRFQLFLIFHISDDYSISLFKQDTSIIGGYKLAMQNSNQNGQTAWAYAGQSLADIEKYGISQVLSENVTA